MNGKKQKVVIKVGTSTLTNNDGNLNKEHIAKIVDECCYLQDNGYEVVLVTSGAIGAGMGQMGISKRPKAVSEKQALACIGQVALTHLYQELFNRHNRIIGQLLLTKGDFADRKRFLHARNLCLTLLKEKVIPIINENDAVVVDEIKVGDNDTLSALVVSLIDAHSLVIVTDIDGFYDSNPNTNPNAKRLERINKITDEIWKMAGSEGSKFGTGGMLTKLKAAEIACKNHADCYIIKGDDPTNIRKVLKGDPIGSCFVKQANKVKARKHWLAYSANKKGSIIIDEGARKALIQGKSLLPVGITAVKGDFNKGDVVSILDGNEKLLAYGMINYDSSECKLIKGQHSEAIEEILGHKYDDVVIHINNIVKVE